MKRAIVLCVAVLASVICTLDLEAGTPDVELKIKINKNGFHDSNGQLIITPFKVKKGEAVRFTFLFDEKTSEVLRDILRDANEQHGYVHAFAPPRWYTFSLPLTLGSRFTRLPDRSS